jgi:hypothetical protein
MFDINRNQWLVIGVLIFLIGLQLRAVSAYWLTEESTRFLAKQSAETAPARISLLTLNAVGSAAPKKVVQPPEWSGWCLVSVGSVVILQSLAMRKPE